MAGVMILWLPGICKPSGVRNGTNDRIASGIALVWLKKAWAGGAKKEGEGKGKQ
jgi:hypothetical protein